MNPCSIFRSKKQSCFIVWNFRRQLIFGFAFHLSENTARTEIWTNQIAANSTFNALMSSQHSSLVANAQEHWLKIYLLICHGGSKKGRHETYSANIENFTLQFYLPNHRLPNQQGIQGTIMFRYRLCDRQHFWRLSMGSKMPYSMLHNLHSNQTNRFEILHFLLNYKSWNKRYQNHRNYYSNK